MHDQLADNGARQRGAVIVVDESQGQVDGGTYPGRGPTGNAAQFPPDPGDIVVQRRRPGAENPLTHDHHGVGEIGQRDRFDPDVE
ncbi:hypothetical protein [Azospirillum sp.]|uniref:hypothetical protein n=1 Tax=Azospirillum sp. TaxID=34012 RepID=UPI002D649E26|nr:hypothetical protein [Azospirillum sp.]HYD70269.1 hypothetical protein [Azospirillum sp.]